MTRTRSPGDRVAGDAHRDRRQQRHERTLEPVGLRHPLLDVLVSEPDVARFLGDVANLMRRGHPHEHWRVDLEVASFAESEGYADVLRAIARAMDQHAAELRELEARR